MRYSKGSIWNIIWNICVVLNFGGRYKDKNLKLRIYFNKLKDNIRININ